VISILKIVTALGWFLFVILHHCRICACTVEQDDEDDEPVIHMRRKVNIVFISWEVVYVFLCWKTVYGSVSCYSSYW